MQIYKYFPLGACSLHPGEFYDIGNAGTFTSSGIFIHLYITQR